MLSGKYYSPLALVLGSALFFACGAEESTDPSQDPAGKGDFVGEFCGGKAGIQCPADQKCKLDGDYPDAGGTCMPQTYCDAPSDCSMLIHPMCVGEWKCVTHQCEWRCEGMPKTCGPFLGGECAADETCDLQSCGDGGSGTCVPKAEFCYELWSPVCGCDGKTYGNDCFRVLAGAALAYEGECKATSCDTSKALCDMVPPTCPEGQVPSVVSSCWGPCVEATSCQCDPSGSAFQCPTDMVCWGTTHTCGPYVR